VGVLCSIAGTAILLLALGLGKRRYRTRVA
jgi:DHA1 family inner membrane transport protein